MPEENCPGLAMARAFGDFCLKDYGLISTPDISYRKLTPHDEFVVLATDGVSITSHFLLTVYIYIYKYTLIFYTLILKIDPDP